jgi:hypothetical protein
MPISNILTGAHGSLTIAPLDTLPGQDAERIAATYEIQQAVGRVTGICLRINTDLEGFHEIGFRHVTSLHEGNIHISGTIDRAYINGALLALLMGRKAFNEEAKSQRIFQPEFNLTIQMVDTSAAGQAELVVNGVKLENWSYSMPEDDFIMEQVSFKAKSIDIRDSENAVPAVPEFVAIDA